MKDTKKIELEKRVEVKVEKENLPDSKKEINNLLEVIIKEELEENQDYNVKKIIKQETDDEKLNVSPDKLQSNGQPVLFTCIHCEKTFNYMKYLNHVSLHSKEKNHLCSICKKQYKTVTQLKRHIHTHTEKQNLKNKLNKRDISKKGLQSDVFSCARCDNKIFSYKEFLKHIAKHSKENNHICLLCNKHYRKVNKFKRHLYTHFRKRNEEGKIIKDEFSLEKNKLVFFCAHCDNKSFVYQDYLEHISSHNTETIHVCSMCNKKYENTNQLKAHVRTHVFLKGTYSCTICEKSYDVKSSLDRHLKTHSGLKLFHCKQCHKSFKSPSSLKTHSGSHTGNKAHMCAQCGKCFSLAASLKNHMHTHTGERPYACTLCSARFVQIGNLKQHMLWHNNEKKHVCTVCDKTFSRKGNMLSHMQTHSGVKPHQCTYCGKSFLRKTNLLSHIFTHTKEKPHGCSECDKSFADKCDLIKHYRTHTGEKPYVCAECGKGFCRKKILINHLDTHNKP